MKYLERYWAFAFLIDNIFMNFMQTLPIATSISYVLLALGIIPAFSNIRVLMNQRTLSTYRFIMAFALIVVVYQFTFGLLHTNDRSWTYLAAKVVSSFCFVTCIMKDPEFYKRKMIPWLSILVAGLIILGARSGSVDLSGRNTLGFANANDIGGLAAICFGLVFISMDKFSKWNLILIAVFIYAVVASGSRTSMACLAIALFLKYGFNGKTIGVLFAGIVAIFALSVSGIQIAAIERLTDTFESRDFVDDRAEVREAAMMMIAENPIEGNGLYAQNTGAAAQISEMGAHNGYLDLMKMIGIPLTLLLIFFLVMDLLKLTKRYLHDYNMKIRAFYYVVVTVPLAAYFEGYMWGVNQMTTTLFFICFAVMNHDINEHPKLVLQR